MPMQMLPPGYYTQQALSVDSDHDLQASNLIVSIFVVFTLLQPFCVIVTRYLCAQLCQHLDDVSHLYKPILSSAMLLLFCADDRPWKPCKS